MKLPKKPKQEPKNFPVRWTAQVVLGATSVALLGNAKHRPAVMVVNQLIMLFMLRAVLAPILGAIAILLASKPYVVFGLVCSQISAVQKLPLDARIGVAVLGFLFQALAYPDAGSAESPEQQAKLREISKHFPYKIIRKVFERGLHVKGVHWLRITLVALLAAAYARKLALRTPGPLLDIEPRIDQAQTAVKGAVGGAVQAAKDAALRARPAGKAE